VVERRLVPLPHQYLTTAAISSSPEHLISGELLLKDLDVFMQKHVGPDARALLAAFACGGNHGIGISEVGESNDPDLKRIAAEGLKLVTPQREAFRLREIKGLEFEVYD